MRKSIIMAALSAACMIIAGTASASEEAEESNVITFQQEAEEQLEKEIGAFEITASQRELAKDNEAGYPVLDAGRGNPNWINTQARYALTRFMDFAMKECELDMSEGSMAGHARQEGIGERFDAAMDPEEIRLANDTVHARYTALMNALGLPTDESAQNAQYYTLVDVLDLAATRYEEDFSEWLKESRTEIDFLNDLAGKKGVVLMYGPGFSAPEGTVRISLANLNEEDYVEIAHRLFELLDEYYEQYDREVLLDYAA